MNDTLSHTRFQQIPSHRGMGCAADGTCNYNRHAWVHFIWVSILVGFFVCIIVGAVFDRCRRRQIASSRGRAIDIEGRRSEPLPKYSPLRDDVPPVYSEQMSPSATLRDPSCGSTISTPERVIYRDSVSSNMLNSVVA
ncbi:hypothetical protein IWW57_001214 [Coemansia sp. S610]|nr:hypothetical protein IWW57_001214 [Coemansia sp. S610]